MENDTSPREFNSDLWMWGTDDSKPRFLHTMLRVSDLDRAMNFYIEGVGMKQLCKPFDVESRRVTGVFLGFDDFASGGCLELVDQWDHTEPYTHGSGYGHISVGAPDMDEMLSRLEAMGAEVTLRPTILISGGPRVAFLKDPDGYAMELIQTRAGA